MNQKEYLEKIKEIVFIRTWEKDHITYLNLINYLNKETNSFLIQYYIGVDYENEYLSIIKIDYDYKYIDEYWNKYKWDITSIIQLVKNPVNFDDGYKELEELNKEELKVIYDYLKII